MRQQFANPIFSSLANKFPKRFNSLFELRILVQNSLKKARLQSILRMCGLCLHFCFGLDPLQLYNMKYAAMH